MAYKKSKRPVNMAVGGAIASALLPFATELLISGPARKKQERLEQRELDEAERKAARDRQKGAMNNYPVHGIKSYSMGGDMYNESPVTQTGQETKISKDATKIEGAKHNEVNPMTGKTGTPVDADQDGEQDVEVEKGEVVVNGYVFSAQLGYAEPAEEISKELAIADNEILSGDRYSKSGYKRKKQILENNLEKLILMQEAEKAKQKADAMEAELEQINNPPLPQEPMGAGVEQGMAGAMPMQEEQQMSAEQPPMTDQGLVDPNQMPQMGLGGDLLNSLKGIEEGMTAGQVKLKTDKFNTGVSRGLNIASNLGQLLLSENRKSPAKNRTVRPVLQQAKLNVSPQIQAVKSASLNANRVASMYGNVQNRGALAASVAATESQKLNEIYGDKLTKEQQIEAQNNQTLMSVDQTNQAIESGNNAAAFAVDNAKQQGRQTIAAQIAKNVQTMGVEDKKMELDGKKAQYMQLATQGGVNIDFESEDFARTVESDPMFPQKMYQHLITNGRIPDAEKLKTLFPSYFK